MPVGFKNSADGIISTAINGIVAASKSQVFMGINQQGRVVLLTTQGNPDSHLILRGGSQPNYDETSIKKAEAAMAIPIKIIVNNQSLPKRCSSSAVLVINLLLESCLNPISLRVTRAVISRKYR